MIRLQDIGKSFGPTILFQSLSWHILPGEKIGLIGDNGSGKSTLLHILRGELVPDTGEKLARNNLRIGYLGQEIAGVDGEILLIEEVLQGRADLLEMERQLEDLYHRLHKEPDSESGRIADRLGSHQDRFHLEGGYSVEAMAKSTLLGLGFREPDFQRPLKTFSGGWRMRARLARILLSSPDLLLLDEPTNHLDLESTVWLERFLKSFAGSLVLISHDRYFLNRIITSIAELERGVLTPYPFSYDRYVREKRARAELLEKQAAQQKKELEKQQKFIDRFRAKATKATQVQSRIRALEKIEVVETVSETASIGFSFQEAGRVNRQVVELRDVTQGYGDRLVYENLNFSLDRGDRVALVGPNGQGKSTLLKIIAGRVPIQGGKVIIGSNAVFRYFAQHQLESLNLEKTVLEEVTDSLPFELVPRARTALGGFLFRDDDVLKQIRVLSGGEKSRVALAKIALVPTNLLLLDEPTNHLDLKSRLVLERALARYTGAIVLISHDRAFIDTVANKVVHVEGGALTPFHGNYTYYERKREFLLPAPGETGSDGDSPDEDDSKLSKKDLRRETARLRQELQTRIGPLKKRLEDLEREIFHCEEKIAELNRLLSDPTTYRDRPKSEQLSKDVHEVRSRNRDLIVEWERLSEEIELISSEYSV